MPRWKYYFKEKSRSFVFVIVSVLTDTAKRRIFHGSVSFYNIFVFVIFSVLMDTATWKHYFKDKSRIFHEFMSFYNIFVCVCFQRTDGYSNLEALLQGKEQSFPRVYELLQYFCLCLFSAY